MTDDPAGLRAAGVPEPVTTAGAVRSGLRDYVAWHLAYDDPDSSLSKRLRRVQAEVDRFLDETAPWPVRVLSICAGDGRDVIEVLARRDDRARVRGTFVENHPELVDRCRRRIAELGAGERLEVRAADAGLTDAYVGAVPADLVVVSGVMGNISATDVERLVHTAPELAAAGGTVLWTRGRMDPDLGPDIRRWFDEAGFASITLVEDIEGTPLRLGVERLVVDPRPLRPGRRLFTFLR